MDSRWLGLALAGGLVWAGYHGHPHAKIAGFVVGGLWLFAQAKPGGVLGQMNVQTKLPINLAVPVGGLLAQIPRRSGVIA